MPQAKQIAIQLGTYDGITFTPTSEYATPKLYDVWNMTSDWNVEWLKASARQRALEGRDRAGVGGFRYEARVTFRTMLPAQAKAIRDLLNDIFEDPMFPRVVKISEDDNIDNGEICNFRGGAYGIRRELTIGRQAVNMEFSNLFRLNRVTDAMLSTGHSVHANHDTQSPIMVYFEYRGANGDLIASEYAEDYAGGGFYNIEWIAENTFVFTNGFGRPSRYDIDPVAGTATRTVLAFLSGSSTSLDIDELGNIYTPHLSQSNGTVKINLQGETLASAEKWTRHVFVDDAHVYRWYEGSESKIEKLDRDTLAIVAQTGTLSLASDDTALLYPETIVHLRKHTGYSIFRVIRKSDMEVIKTVDSREQDNWYDPRRMIYDENGNIYVLAYKSEGTPQDDVLILDKELNFIRRITVQTGTSGPASEIAYSPQPFNNLFIRKSNLIKVFDMQGNLVNSFEIQAGSTNLRSRFLNVHPGRATIKFKVLGLTKQF